MRKRNKRVWAHLNDNEYERFMEQVKQSGLSMESYLRFLINGLVPKPKPPVDYFAMTNELRTIGRSIRQIASKATAYHIINAGEYERYSTELDKQISAIQDAVELPYKITPEDVH
jgi:exopolysaccharide biosynthesis protein